VSDESRAEAARRLRAEGWYVAADDLDAGTDEPAHTVFRVRRGLTQQRRGPNANEARALEILAALSEIPDPTTPYDKKEAP
jgi:hypothetical protein